MLRDLYGAIIVLMAFKKLAPVEWYTDADVSQQIGYIVAIVMAVGFCGWLAHLAIEEPLRRRLKAR